MRVRLVHHVDVDVRWVPAGVGGRAPAAESRGREIERSPEELDGAGLSEEPRAEALEDYVGLEKDGGEGPRVVAVVRAELDVLGKRHGDGDLVRHQRDLRIGHADARERIE